MLEMLLGGTGEPSVPDKTSTSRSSGATGSRTPATSPSKTDDTRELINLGALKDISETHRQDLRRRTSNAVLAPPAVPQRTQIRTHPRLAAGETAALPYFGSLNRSEELAFFANLRRRLSPADRLQETVSLKDGFLLARGPDRPATIKPATSRTTGQAVTLRVAQDGRKARGSRLQRRPDPGTASEAARLTSPSSSVDNDSLRDPGGQFRTP